MIEVSFDNQQPEHQLYICKKEAKNRIVFGISVLFSIFY
jgi:hypothetical protein